MCCHQHWQQGGTPVRDCSTRLAVGKTNGTSAEKKNQRRRQWQRQRRDIHSGHRSACRAHLVGHVTSQTTDSPLKCWNRVASGPLHPGALDSRVGGSVAKSWWIMIFLDLGTSVWTSTSFCGLGIDRPVAKGLVSLFVAFAPPLPGR